MGKLLLDESPLLVLPSLAIKLGLEKAIIVQQLHYLTLNTGSVKSKASGWNSVFPFIKERQLQRHFEELELDGIITAIRTGKSWTREYSLNRKSPVFGEVSEEKRADLTQLQVSPLLSKEEVKIPSSPKAGETQERTKVPDPRIGDVLFHWKKRQLEHQNLPDPLSPKILAGWVKRLDRDFTTVVIVRAIDEFFQHPDPWIKSNLGMNARGFLHQFPKLIEKLSQVAPAPKRRLLSDLQHD